MAGKLEKDTYSFKKVQEAANYLQSVVNIKPSIAIICGSGLSGLGDLVEEKIVIKYDSIPHFQVSTVAGHIGQLVFGKIGGKDVMCMQGRFHPYEGHEAWKIGFPIRVMSLLGIKTLIITNAAGGINRSYNVGDFMVLKDHISIPALSGYTPLLGHNDENFGPRFPATTPFYDKDLRNKFLKVVEEKGFKNITHQGVYCNVAGPSYETIAELKMIQTLGGDAVGMSTAHEVIAAAHAGLKGVVCSLITNKCVLEYECTDVPNHEEVLQTAKNRAHDMESVVSKFISLL